MEFSRAKQLMDADLERVRSETSCECLSVRVLVNDEPEELIEVACTAQVLETIQNIHGPRHQLEVFFGGVLITSGTFEENGMQDGTRLTVLKQVLPSPELFSHATHILCSQRESALTQRRILRDFNAYMRS